MKNFKKITTLQLGNMLLNFKKEVTATGVAFGSVVYYVDESGSKVSKGVKVLKKLVRTSITIGANYEGRINRDLIKNDEEANFTAQAMSGKEYMNEDRVLLRDTKTGLKRYLKAEVENKTKPKTVYFHNGQMITKDMAVSLGLFMPSYFAEKTTSGRGNMSVENDFHTINPNLESIRSITLNKMKYIIEN